MGGQAWVRILDFAILYVFLALGLNIVVGFAGLLDLGYIAFYAVGAYTWALASPHFGLHLPIWAILPIGAAGLHRRRAARFADPEAARRLPGHRDPRFRRNRAHFHEQPECADQHHQRAAGHSLIDPVTIGGLKFSGNTQLFGLTLSGPMKYYYLLVALAILVIIINLRLQHSRIGRAWAGHPRGRDRRQGGRHQHAQHQAARLRHGGQFRRHRRRRVRRHAGFRVAGELLLMESIMILAMVVLGGMGHIPGVILGAVLLSILPEVLRYGVGPAQMALFGKMLVDPESLRMLLFGLALVLVMRFARPACGLAGAQARTVGGRQMRERNLPVPLLEARRPSPSTSGGVKALARCVADHPPR